MLVLLPACIFRAHFEWLSEATEAFGILVRFESVPDVRPP